MTHPLCIRPLEPRDLPEVARLLEHLGYPATVPQVEARLARMAEAGGSIALVSALGEGCTGVITAHRFASVHRDAPVAWITTLVVDPAARRQSVGSALVREAEHWASAQGAERVSLTSGLERSEAHAFYERLGYVHSGRRYTRSLP